MKAKLLIATTLMAIVMIFAVNLGQKAAACPNALLSNVHTSYCGNVCFTVDATWANCDGGPYTYTIKDSSGNVVATYTGYDTTHCFNSLGNGNYTVQVTTSGAATPVYSFSHTILCQK